MKQPPIQQNILGKREVEEFNRIIDDIKSGKIKYNAIEADEFRKANKIGEYREWEFDHKLIEEIQAKVSAGEVHMHPVHKIRYPRGNKPGGYGPRGTYNNCKKQRIAEEKALIAEIENM
jgi:hypothetical protein